MARRAAIRERQSMFRKTTMRRAILEGLLIYLAAQALALVPVSVWPPALFPVELIARTALFVLPPVWAAIRVVSTKREKMSRRFWRLGPILAVCCVVADAAVALLIGEADTLGGPVNGPDIARFTAHGSAALAPAAFVGNELLTLGIFAVYFTIAVVCTRLANGGFLRFTMPAGKGRVTL